MCRGGCCCHFSLKCRMEAMKHSAIHLIVFGSIITALGVAMRLLLQEWIFNFGYALVWAGVSAVVTGIGSRAVSKTMHYTDEDWGFRGLAVLSLICIVCVGGAVGLITWQMWDANYFMRFEEDAIYYGTSNVTLGYTEWFFSIVVYGFVDFASLLIIGSALINIMISCFCPEASDVVKDV